MKSKIVLRALRFSSPRVALFVIGVAAGAPAGRVFAAAAVEVAASDPPANSSPLAELKKSNAELKRVISKQAPSWSPEKDTKTSDVRKLVGQFLDFDELAKRSLAKHWDTLTANQRKDFTATLRELVERSYLKQIHGRPDYEVKFDHEEKHGRDATVTASLDTTSRGKTVNVSLEYRLIYKGTHWVVYDIVTDEQSLLETYRAEFNKIINKESFDALLKRMKKKLAEKSANADKSP